MVEELAICLTFSKRSIQLHIRRQSQETLCATRKTGYTPLSRPHLTATCHRLYSSLKEDLIEVLASHLAITTDLWTSRAYSDIHSLRHADFRMYKTNIRCSPIDIIYHSPTSGLETLEISLSLMTNI